MVTASKSMVRTTEGHIARYAVHQMCLKFMLKDCTEDNFQQMMLISETWKQSCTCGKTKQERSPKLAMKSHADICADRILSILLNLLY